MPTSTPWDGTSWDVTAPDIDQPVGNDYKEIYDLRKGIAIRMNKEHETLATSSAGGVHKQGTARMWHLPTASIPNLQPNGDALDAGDNGMMWHDTTTDLIYVLYDYTDPTIGNGWISITEEIVGTETDSQTVAVTTGYQYFAIDGARTKVYTKYITGTLASTADTLEVTHGIANFGNTFLSVECYFEDSNGDWRIKDHYNSDPSGYEVFEYIVTANETVITIGRIGTSIAAIGNRYRIKIEYTS